MYMTSYEPWNVLNRLNKDISGYFSGMPSAVEDGSSVATSSWTPAVDIKEEESRFVITADVPGVDPKDIEVTMENGVLTIRGERTVESETKDKDYRRIERRHGTFYRRFALPDYADAEEISANSKNGVLTLTIPKSDSVKPRKITVKS